MEEAQLENDLSLLAVSGMADQLQEDVKECISDFIDAGMKIWIVTGDKDSTAKSIGYQCGILNEKRNMTNVSKNNASNKEQLAESIMKLASDHDIMISGTSIA